MTRRARKIVFLYQYYEPDDVVSARHIGDLARGLARRGWLVEVYPSNRSRHSGVFNVRREESSGGVMIRRIWRPRFSVDSAIGRIGSAGWLLIAWLKLSLQGRLRSADIVVVGTDPPLSILIVPVIKWLNRRVRAVHWVFDLYPDAAAVGGILSRRSTLFRLMHSLVARAYKECDLVIDVGPCMTARLLDHLGIERLRTIPPWALVEPDSIHSPDPTLRKSMFGEARLGLLYSGNLGRAHEFETFLELARSMRDLDVGFCFSCTGVGRGRLQDQIRVSDTNIRLVDVAKAEDLSAHLSAADVHLASVRQGWAGVVVPSKFFGSLAMGRPVLFAGDKSSSIASWIRELNVGWILSRETLGSVADVLRDLIDRPDELAALQLRCRSEYFDRFSFNRAMDTWSLELDELTSDFR